MATRVGQAYVALSVDGSGMDDDIANEISKVDFKRIGDKYGKEMSKQLRGHLEKDLAGGFQSSLKDLQRAIDSDDAVKKSVERMLTINDKQGRLTRMYKKVAKDAGLDFSGEFGKVVRVETQKVLRKALLDAAARGDKLDLSALIRKASLDSGDGSLLLPGPAIEKAVARSKQAAEQITRDRDAEITKRINAMLREQKEYLRQETRRQAEVKSMLKTAAENRIAFSKKTAETEEKILQRAVESYDKAWTEAHAEQRKRINETWRLRNKAYQAWVKMDADIAKGRTDERGYAIPRVGDGGRYDRIGRLFGGGSRNNFLNFAGRSVANLTRLLDGSFRALGRFGQGFRAAGIDASFFQKTVGGFRSVFAGFGGALAGIARAAPAVAVALAALVSVAFGLVGILTALASTIVSGVTAALTIFTVTATAAVAAGGLLVAAFMSMTDAQKKLLKDAFIPLREMMVGIGQVMIREMVPAFATWSENLQEAILLLDPLAQVMGKAFAEAGNIFTAALSGPGFQRFSEALTVYLPNIVTRLTSALGGFLNGLLGMFAAMMPFVNQFAEYLDRVATRFSEWANSAEGQNTIVNWTTRAVESLKSLWGFIREFTGFLTDVLFSPEAQNAGNSIFDSLSRAFSRFRAAIADGSLEQWFKDSAEFAKSLGEAMSALGTILGGLYSSGILTFIGKSIEFVGLALTGTTTTIRASLDVFDAFIWLLQNIDVVGRFAVEALQSVALGLISLAQTAIGSIGAINDVTGGALNFLTGGAVSKAEAALSSLRTEIEGIGKAWSSSRSEVSRNPINGQINVNTHFSSSGNSSMFDMVNQLYGGKLKQPGLTGLGSSLFSSNPTPSLRIPELRDLGRDALKNTTSGGGGGSSAQPKYNNPYAAWANSLIREANSITQQIRKAMAEMGKSVSDAMKGAAGSLDGKEVIESLRNLRTSLREQGTSLVDAAQNALNSAARSLANASSPEAARDALREVKKAQQDLAKAQAAQKRLNAATNTIAKQVLSYRSRIDGLISDSPWERAMARSHATLADYAAARGILAERIADANDKLADAISNRDQMRDAVVGAIQSYGALTAVTAQVVNGVTQALTATDITTSLQDRLDKIQNFQNNLRMLAAQGLSDAAYRQIVDAGVEEGSTLAEALLAGGAGAIQQTNQLVGQINSLADNLGIETSNRMYQAGVHAAQGLVDGLTSLDAQLASAATQLGNTIANSIKRSLGIASPARRMIQDMESVGDGIVVGLGNQHNKVGVASASLANRVSVSPEVAAYAARQGTAATVSGNGADPRFRDLVVHTPTENPEAVAREVLNEITGRL